MTNQISNEEVAKLKATISKIGLSSDSNFTVDCSDGRSAIQNDAIILRFPKGESTFSALEVGLQTGQMRFVKDGRLTAWMSYEDGMRQLAK